MIRGISSNKTFGFDSSISLISLKNNISHILGDEIKAEKIVEKIHLQVKKSHLHQRAPSINKPYTKAPSSGTGYFLSSIISNWKTNKSIGILRFLNKDKF